MEILTDDPTPPKQEPMEEVCTLPSGYTLFRQKNGVGGHTYWSDAISGGVMIWDTCLVDEGELLMAMAQERLRYAEDMCTENLHKALSEEKHLHVYLKEDKQLISDLKNRLNSLDGLVK